MTNKNIETEIKDMINAKLTEDMAYIHDERFSVKSKIYREKLQGVLEHGKAMKEKKDKANSESVDIKNKLALLNAEYLKETDEKKMKQIEQQKLEYRLKLQDLDDLLHTNISNIINGKYLKELNLPHEESQRESIEYSGAIESRITYYRELIELIKNNIVLLSNSKQAHPYYLNQSLIQEIKTTSFDENDGWTSREPNLRFRETTYVYPESIPNR